MRLFTDLNEGQKLFSVRMVNFKGFDYPFIIIGYSEP